MSVPSQKAGPSYPPPAPEEVMLDPTFPAKIVDHQQLKRDGRLERHYCLEFKGYPSEECTWVAAHDLVKERPDAQEMIDEYMARQWDSRPQMPRLEQAQRADPWTQDGTGLAGFSEQQGDLYYGYPLGNPWHPTTGPRPSISPPPTVPPPPSRDPRSRFGSWEVPAGASHPPALQPSPARGAGAMEEQALDALASKYYKGAAPPLPPQPQQPPRGHTPPREGPLDGFARLTYEARRARPAFPASPARPHTRAGALGAVPRASTAGPAGDGAISAGPRGGMPAGSSPSPGPERPGGGGPLTFAGPAAERARSAAVAEEGPGGRKRLREEHVAPGRNWAAARWVVWSDAVIAKVVTAYRASLDERGCQAGKAAGGPSAGDGAPAGAPAEGAYPEPAGAQGAEAAGGQAAASDLIEDRRGQAGDLQPQAGPSGEEREAGGQVSSGNMSEESEEEALDELSEETAAHLQKPQWANATVKGAKMRNHDLYELGLWLEVAWEDGYEAEIQFGHFLHGREYCHLKIIFFLISRIKKKRSAKADDA